VRCRSCLYPTPISLPISLPRPTVSVCVTPRSLAEQLAGKSQAFSPKDSGCHDLRNDGRFKWVVGQADATALRCYDAACKQILQVGGGGRPSPDLRAGRSRTHAVFVEMVASKNGNLTQEQLSMLCATVPGVKSALADKPWFRKLRAVQLQMQQGDSEEEDSEEEDSEEEDSEEEDSEEEDRSEEDSKEEEEEDDDDEESECRQLASTLADSDMLVNLQWTLTNVDVQVGAETGAPVDQYWFAPAESAVEEIGVNLRKLKKLLQTPAWKAAWKAASPEHAAVAKVVLLASIITTDEVGFENGQKGELAGLPPCRGMRKFLFERMDKCDAYIMDLLQHLPARINEYIKLVERAWKSGQLTGRHNRYAAGVTREAAGLDTNDETKKGDKQAGCAYLVSRLRALCKPTVAEELAKATTCEELQKALAKAKPGFDPKGLRAVQIVRDAPLLMEQLVADGAMDTSKTPASLSLKKAFPRLPDARCTFDRAFEHRRASILKNMNLPLRARAKLKLLMSDRASVREARLCEPRRAATYLLRQLHNLPGKNRRPKGAWCRRSSKGSLLRRRWFDGARKQQLVAFAADEADLTALTKAARVQAIKVQEGLKRLRPSDTVFKIINKDKEGE
jgi:hypothetical protein